MNLSHRPRKNADYYLEQLDDELLLYHLNETKIMYCNQTASLVWHLCDGQRTVEEIIDLLSDAYPESAGTIADDVHAVLRQFVEFGGIALDGDTVD